MLSVGIGQQQGGPSSLNMMSLTRRRKPNLHICPFAADEINKIITKQKPARVEGGDSTHSGQTEGEDAEREGGPTAMSARFRWSVLAKAVLYARLFGLVCARVR